MLVRAEANLFAKFSSILIAFVFLALSIEHKYDKLFRHFSRTLIPEGLLLHGFEKKIYFYATDIAAFVLFCLALFALKIPIRRLFLEKGTLFLWILFSCAFLSICNSQLSHYPVAYTRLIQLLTPILLFSYLAHTHSEERRKILFTILFAIGLFQSTLAIGQYFIKAPVGLRLLNEARIFGTFVMQDGTRWIIDRLFHHVEPFLLIIRASGTLHFCNLLGGFLCLSLLISYSFFIENSKRSIRWLLAFSLIVQTFALAITYSRSAIFAWILGTLIWFGYFLYHRGIRQMLQDSRMRFLALTIFAAIAINSGLLSEQYLQRGGVVNYNIVAKGSDQVRIDSQSLAFKMIAEHPILGVGYQQFLQTATTQENPRPPLTHNIYLLLASETGLISLLAFLGFIAVLLLKTARAPYSPQIASLLAIFFGFLFIGGCDFYPIFLQQGRLMFFCSAGLLAAEANG